MRDQLFTPQTAANQEPEQRTIPFPLQRVLIGSEEQLSLFLIEYNAWTDSTGFKLFLNDYNYSLIYTIIPQSRQCVSTRKFDVGCKTRPQLSNRDFETTADGPFWSGTVCRTQPDGPNLLSFQPVALY